MIRFVLALGPLTYIILWMYSLLTYIIPTLSVNIYNLGSLLTNLTVIQIIYHIAFWVFGLPIFVYMLIILIGTILSFD